MGVTVSTMSLLLDRLEGHGYVARERDPADGRRVHVRLTQNGETLRRANSVLDPQLVEKLLRRLPSKDRKAALHGLRLLANAADDMRRAS